MSKVSIENYRNFIRSVFKGGINYFPELAKVFGGSDAAVMLSQLLYWNFNPTAEMRDGWFWKTVGELYEETGLTKSEQSTARRKLRHARAIECERRGNPCRWWYRVDPDSVAAAVGESGKDKRKRTQRPRGKDGKFAGSGDSIKP